MRQIVLFILLGLLLSLSACGGGGSNAPENPPNPPPAQTGSYVVTAWSELGMHCIDGKDYSLFAVLPPYNSLHAQILKRGDPPTLITAGVTVTYEAVADSTGSINTSSSGKTNFWSHVQALFGSRISPDLGLTGTPVQSTTPHPLTYNSSLGYWEAIGIPTIPTDDAGRWNPYPMVKVVAKDGNGIVLATTTAVLAVSDEMSCSTCHASGSNLAAQPSTGWENDPDPNRDVKLNTLKKHDDRWNVSGYLPELKTRGYVYQASLYQTAKSGTPILCAACHASNALGANGLAGINPITEDMHALHSTVVNPSFGVTLDNATTPAASCYLCHPGPQTLCQRGAMNKTACFDCHGNLSKVGASTRQGWLDLPSCQMCHNGGLRFTSTFNASNAWRTTTDSTFATNLNKPTAGKSLFRYSSGHGSLNCSACHGSQHAEYPSLKANDNQSSVSLQGYKGKLVECSVCHVSAPSASSGGPHGLHNVGQGWISAHRQAAENGGTSACAYCHGADFRGSPLSAVATNRAFSVGDGGTKSFAAGHPISCYDCHNGPSGD